MGNLTDQETPQSDTPSHVPFTTRNKRGNYRGTWGWGTATVYNQYGGKGSSKVYGSEIDNTNVRGSRGKGNSKEWIPEPGKKK